MTMFETDESISGIRDFRLGDSPSVDAFGRLRVGSPTPVFENKNLFQRNINQWEEQTNGAGASISYLSDESSVSLTVGTVSGEYAIRQTSRYHAYVPGKSQLILLTAVLGTGKTNVTQRIGYFDDNDGLFFELADSTISVVRRTSTSGAVVNNTINQTNWNLDKLNGNGKSGITLDLTKAQIFIIDFQWLAAGRIRFGFNFDGKIVYCHEINNANILDVPYMATPSLPIRYEIRNTGVSASSTSLKEICCSISSEGGYTLPGYEFSASNGIAKRNISVRTPIFAIRLAGTFGGKENRRTCKFERLNFYANTNDVFFELMHMHNPSAITATWNTVATSSAVEYSNDITAITGNPEHIISSGFVTAGTGNRATAEGVNSQFINQHSFISQNFDSSNSQTFVVYATPFAGAADTSASIEWIEFD